MNISRTHRILAASLCSLLAVIVAYLMWQRYTLHQLWQFEPLFFELALWSALVLFFRKGFSKNAALGKWLIAGYASAALFSLGFMPMPFSFTLFFAVIPILAIEAELRKTQGWAPWTMTKLAFHVFLLWNITASFWVVNTAFVAGLLAHVLNALVMTVPVVIYHGVRGRLNHNVGRLSFISLWISIEWGHHLWDLSFPWLTLGNAFGHMPWLIQWYSYTGAFGGSLWVLLVNMGLYEVWLHRKNSSKLPRLVLTSLAILLPAVFSVWLYYQENPNSATTREVIAVQPNFEPHYQKFHVSEETQFLRFMELTQKYITDSTAYVLFPETSFGSINTDKIRRDPRIEGFYKLLQNYPNTYLITGLNAYKVVDPNTPTGGAVRDSRGIKYIPYNAAAQLHAHTDSIPLYIKSKLVPGAESMPYIGDIPLFNSLVLNLGGSNGLTLGTQPQREVFQGTQGSVAPVICYESIYGAYVTEYVERGAQALFVLTNDGWWGNTPGHRQHMYLSALRAIENRRSVVRAANTGISCWIDSRGVIHQPTTYETTTAVRAQVPFKNTRTFYTQNKDLVARLALLVAVLTTLSSISRWSVRHRTSQKKNSPQV